MILNKILERKKNSFIEQFSSMKWKNISQKFSIQNCKSSNIFFVMLIEIEFDFSCIYNTEDQLETNC